MVIEIILIFIINYIKKNWEILSTLYLQPSKKKAEKWIKNWKRRWPSASASFKWIALKFHLQGILCMSILALRSSPSCSTWKEGTGQEVYSGDGLEGTWKPCSCCSFHGWRHYHLCQLLGWGGSCCPADQDQRWSGHVEGKGVDLGWVRGIRILSMILILIIN